MAKRYGAFALRVGKDREGMRCLSISYSHLFNKEIFDSSPCRIPHLILSTSFVRLRMLDFHKDLNLLNTRLSTWRI